MTQEESQRSLVVVDTHKDPLTMLARRNPGYRQKNPGNYGGSSENTTRGNCGGLPKTAERIHCIHYAYKGHLKDNCNRIVVYPQVFKSMRRSSQQTQQTQPAQFKPTAHTSSNVNSSSSANNQSQGSGYFLTEQQY